MIERLCRLLEEAVTIYVSDCFGREDDCFKEKIRSTVAEAREALVQDDDALTKAARAILAGEHPDGMGLFKGRIHMSIAVAERAVVKALRTASRLSATECPTCGATDPLENEYCSNGFHAQGPTYWPDEPSDEVDK